MNNKILFLLFFLLLACVRNNYQDETNEFLYIGTFSERNSRGLYVFEFNRDSMQFSLLQTIPGQVSPSFLEVHPSKKYLYSVHRGSIINDKEWGTVSAFSVDAVTGILTLINEQSSYGKGPCHISFDKSGRYAFVSNYNDGNLVVYKVNDNGSVSDSIQLIQHKGSSANLQRQERAHVHSALISHDNKFLYVADLGIDKVMIYQLNADNGLLNPAITPYAEVKPGAGPRHFVIHPNSKFAYLAEELSSTTCVFVRDTINGALSEIQRISSIPADCDTFNTNADIHTDADGRFLYVSNRGHNSLAIYSIDSSSGLLTLIDYQSALGDHPRNFMIDNTGKLLFVANRNSDNIQLFRIIRESGKLDFAGVTLELPGAVCIKMLKL